MSITGSGQMDRSQKDGPCTTSTGTNKITGSPTCNSSHRPNTNESTVDVNCEAGNGGNPASHVTNSNLSQKSTGTSPQRGGHCTGVAVLATSVELYRKSVCVDCGSEVHVDGHPTQKPLKLMEYLCKLVSVPGSIILDPFAGSGSTLVAAKRLGRKYIGVDIGVDYCKIAEARLKREEVIE